MEKIVNLFEDMNEHEVNLPSYNKMKQEQEKEIQNQSKPIIDDEASYEKMKQKYS